MQERITGCRTGQENFAEKNICQSEFGLCY